MLLANKEGIVVTGPLINMIGAGVGNAVVVFAIPVLVGQLVGVKSVKILKVHLFNNAAGNTSVLIGNGVGAGVPFMPALFTANGLEDIYDNLLEVESFADIVAWPDVLVGALGIDIQLEVAVIG